METYNNGSHLSTSPCFEFNGTAQNVGFLLFFAILITLALGGVFTNATTIKTFIFLGLKDGMTAIFLTLAMSDLCFNIVCVIQWLFYLCFILEVTQNAWIKTEPISVADICANVALVFGVTTALSTSFLSIVRCLGLAVPFTCRHKFTTGTRLLASALFFVVTIVLHVPSFGAMTMVPIIDTCWNSTRLMLWDSENRRFTKRVVSITSQVCVTLLAEIITGVGVFYLAFKLRGSVRVGHVDIGNANSDVHNSISMTTRERKVVLQVFAICVIFIFCNVIKIVHSLAMVFNPEYNFGKPLHEIYAIMVSLRILFDCINSSLKFFVYYFLNPRFKRHCFKLKAL